MGERPTKARYNDYEDDFPSVTGKENFYRGAPGVNPEHSGAGYQGRPQTAKAPQGGKKGNFAAQGAPAKAQ